jgi:hypothetical protein
MGIVDDKIKIHNVEQVKARCNAALEHMAELERQRIASDGYKDPHIAAFKEKRRKQAMQNKKF